MTEHGTAYLLQELTATGEAVAPNSNPHVYYRGGIEHNGHATILLRSLIVPGAVLANTEMCGSRVCTVHLHEDLCFDVQFVDVLNERTGVVCAHSPYDPRSTSSTPSSTWPPPTRWR